MNLPADLSPELAAWMRVQMTIAASRAVEPLQQELRDLDGFLDSLLVAFSQLVPVVLEADPDVAARLAPHWRHAAERFEAIGSAEPRLADDEALHLLECRHLLYRACEKQGLWPQRIAGAKRSTRHIVRRMRQQ